MTVVPRRPSRHNSQSEPIIIVSHDRFPGVYVSKHDANTLYTKNLVPGQAPLYDDDVVISVKDNDGSVVEYRECDPYRSKFAAAILSGLKIYGLNLVHVCTYFTLEMIINLESLFHISVILLDLGKYGLCSRPPQLEDSCKHGRQMLFNIVPIIHVNSPRRYRMLINMVDVLFRCSKSTGRVSLAAYLNALNFLKTGGHYLLFVQLIVLNQEAGVILCSVLCSNQKSLSSSECSTSLEPFDGDHAYVFYAFHMIEMVDPSCLVTNKFWTDPSSHRGDGERVTIYEQLKTCQFLCCLKHPADTLSFKHMAWFKVERNYIAIEKYMSRCDEVFELIAYQPFESADDALVHLNAVCNGMFLT
ncbi:hypothetical protein OROMI_023757 [Orobanche minor]